MTDQDRMQMYLEKKQFIENLNEVFQMEPSCPEVEGVSYEVYSKQLEGPIFTGVLDYMEWIVVHFAGGGKCPKVVSGNSNISNFRVVGSLLTGGFYDHMRMYKDLAETGYERIDL